MKNYKLTIENGIITDIDYFRVKEPSADGELPEYEEIEACFYIPKDVAGFSDDPQFRDSLIGFDPLAIEVEEGNEVYEAENNCLIRKKDRTMVMGCRNSSIPGSGIVEHIGPCALCAPIVPEAINLGNMQIPDGIKTIGYRAFANGYDEDVMITVPDSVERIGSMAFMMTPAEDSSCVITFHGSPELEPGVFGTKAEAVDCDSEIYKNLPDIIYANPDKLLVRGLKNSSVEAYCRKYGISFEVIEEYYEAVLNAIFAGNVDRIDYSDDFYKAFDEVYNSLKPAERKIIKDVYLKGTLFRALRKLKNPIRSKNLSPFIEADDM